jgi:hypothetical protein
MRESIFSLGVSATVTLGLYTSNRERFKPPVSLRGITHYDEDVIGLSVWCLHLELEHVVVTWESHMSLATNIENEKNQCPRGGMFSVSFAKARGRDEG